MKKIIDFLKPEWIFDKPKAGSMGAADKKSAVRFCISATVVFTVIYAMMYFNLFGTYLNDYYTRSGAVAHFFSWMAALGSIYSLWKAPDSSLSEKNGWIAGVSILVLLAAAILLGAGFNFDLHGIE